MNGFGGCSLTIGDSRPVLGHRTAILGTSRRRSGPNALVGNTKKLIQQGNCKAPN